MDDRKVIAWLWDKGYFFSPGAIAFGSVTKPELSRLTLKDGIVQAALAEAQDFNGLILEQFSFEVHGRRAIHDGIIGPATERMIEAPRCGEPDFYPPDVQRAMQAVGSGGNWPRCHGIGDYHAVNINITNQAPSHVKPHLKEILERVRKANQEIGLQMYYGGVGSPIQDGKTPYNLTVEFVERSGGWIGLAEVMSNVGCSARAMFSKYLASYMRGSPEEAIKRQWAVLFLHEHGHNKGSGHTSGGIMNPYILALAASWKNDVLSSWLRTRYGGKPIITTPDTPDDPKPSDTFFRGNLELIQGGQSRGKFILIPVTSVI